MKIAVVDDSKEDAQHIVRYLYQYQEEYKLTFQIKEFNAGFDFLEEYHGEYDVIFLDIEMPGSNGLDVAREIRLRDEAVGIIFITSLAQYAIDGYEVRAIDFMVKPVGYYNFSTKLQKALRFMETHKERDILIHDKEGILRLKISSTFYIEKEGDYLLFHTQQECFRTRGSMKEMKEKVDQLSFSECTSGCLIHLKYVKRTGRDSVLLVTGQELPVSRRLKKQFTQDYIKYVGGM